MNYSYTDDLLKVRQELDKKMSIKGLNACKSLLSDGKTIGEVVVLLEADNSNFAEQKEPNFIGCGFCTISAFWLCCFVFIGTITLYSLLA
jgi:hypothetical protein